MKKQIPILALMLFSINAFAAETAPRRMGAPPCTMEAKLCPDGSYVSRTQPLCDFAPCPEDGNPEGTQTIEGHTSSGTISPVMPETSRYPDYPLNFVPQNPFTVKFLFDHRSALNARQVTVQGVVVKTLLADQSCKTPQGHSPFDRPPGMCAQPRIVIADTNNPDRDENYDTTVMLKEDDDTPYQTGQKTSVTGLVFSNSNYVIIHKGNETVAPLQ